MSVQMVLLPVFVLVGLAFALLLGMAAARTGAITGGRSASRISRCASRTGPNGSPRSATASANQFEIPVLFYVLIALALPLRKADLVIVLLSWVFVVTRFVHAGIFVTSNDVRTALAGLVRRRARVVRDVALLRPEDAVVELTRSRTEGFRMTPAARLSAAIELIGTIDADRVPAAKALKEWGTAHRYAGSGDRAAIAGLIWDVLRRRASSAWIMDADTPRARVLGMLKLERKLDADAIAALCDGGRFAPEPLTEARTLGAIIAIPGRSARARRRRLSGMARRPSGAGLRR